MRYYLGSLSYYDTNSSRMRMLDLEVFHADAVQQLCFLPSKLLGNAASISLLVFTQKQSYRIDLLVCFTEREVGSRERSGFTTFISPFISYLLYLEAE